MKPGIPQCKWSRPNHHSHSSQLESQSDVTFTGSARRHTAHAKPSAPELPPELPRPLLFLLRRTIRTNRHHLVLPTATSNIAQIDS